MSNLPLLISVDTEKRKVTINGVNYSFEFFHAMTHIEWTAVYRFKNDWQNGVVELQRVELVKDIE